MSAGIAHEIQNPLNFVINFSKMSRKLLEDLNDILEEVESKIGEDTQDELQEIMEDLQCNINKIEENGVRASSIVKGILLYSRGNENDFIPTDLAKLVKEYVWLSYHSVRANNKSFNISIEEDYQENLPLVKVIPQDYSRAVLNLMNNACYAVFSRSVKASEQPYNPSVKVRLWQEDEDINLTIEDNGPGLSGEVKAHLFTPFFTTKPAGEGTGLGLSITRSIVEEKHGGRIEVDSREGEYTRFKITIPINH